MVSEFVFHILRTSLICWFFVIPVGVPTAFIWGLLRRCLGLGAKMARSLWQIERQIIYAFEVEAESLVTASKGYRDLAGI